MGRVVLPGGGESEKPFVAGTYEGDYAFSRAIPLGFKPSCVIVQDECARQLYLDGTFPTYVGGMAVPGRPCTDGRGAIALEVTDAGFQVWWSTGNNSAIRTNEGKRIYIAFR